MPHVCIFVINIYIFKAKDITPSITWKREAWKEEAQDDLPFKGDVGEASERWDGGHNYGLFRAHRYHLELNCTELNSIKS